MLSWNTASEVDNVGFILERAYETHDNASLQWEMIASYQTHESLCGQGNCSYATDYEFTDQDVLSGETYSYRLSDVDVEGAVTVQDVISITLEETPELTQLLPATPNPFNPSTKIQYTLSETLPVNLKVINMQGQVVQTIIQDLNQSAGSYSVHWNGKNDSGLNSPSGIYLLVLNTEQIVKTQKVMLLR